MLNEIRSKYILNLVFMNLQKRMKMKILKYNNKLKKKLNIKLKDFQQYKKLKELNQKLNINIEDTNINIINLSRKCIGNEEFEYFGDVEFGDLKTLNLNGNNLTNINAIENIKSEKLETLFFHDNYIINIDIFEKINLNELRELDLSYNKITDIYVFTKANFSKLEKLLLGSNFITDINILENANLNELKELDLSENKISDIKVFINTKFKKLNLLYLIGNQIDEYAIVNSLIISKLRSKIKSLYI